MGQLKGQTNFNPERDIPSLEGKVIFITGGTAGLGAESVKALAKHSPRHIYFTGRNSSAADALVRNIKAAQPSASLSFLQMDMTSLSSVRTAIDQGFTHDRLDIMMCNAGVMAKPPELTKDGFEVQFGINHLAHALMIRQLTPVLLKTAEDPNSDVRLVCLTSTGWRGHPKQGVDFDRVRTTQESTGGSWIRYGQSKLANVVYAAEFARRNPSILAVSVHPGVVVTDLVNDLNRVKKTFVYATSWVQGINLLQPEQGALNQLWAAAGATRSEVVNGAFYMPVGVESNSMLDNVATSQDFAKRLWQWTEEALADY
ncbi:oxidoreductase [Cryphonectria parasitica EP155]|uniref:Oxidoreductase n=1 Tax=Cryphonectria parasitica (strain ATCC 38755 / EP155) TaxID=660469 RepID=A0A9P4Y2Z8_CRYP1|nr:oxidoreductase [Cryphonectria parasitica EP155]KAF3765718.1 oxidoreductase [Cryphonectria parasitica EP155]